jgi:hypothetical protein
MLSEAYLILRSAQRVRLEGRADAHARLFPPCRNFLTTSEAGVQSKGLWQAPSGTDRPL